MASPVAATATAGTFGRRRNRHTRKRRLTTAITGTTIAASSQNGITTESATLIGMPCPTTDDPRRSCAASMTPNSMASVRTTSQVFHASSRAGPVDRPSCTGVTISSLRQQPAAVRTGQPPVSAVVPLDGELAVPVGCHFLHPRDVDDGRSMNPRELLRVQLLLQLVHRHADEKRVGADVQADVIGGRIEPVHLLGVHQQIAVVVAHREAFQIP